MDDAADPSAASQSVKSSDCRIQCLRASDAERSGQRVLEPYQAPAQEPSAAYIPVAAGCAPGFVPCSYLGKNETFAHI